jgi:hypothetical protein
MRDVVTSYHMLNQPSVVAVPGGLAAHTYSQRAGWGRYGLCVFSCTDCTKPPHLIPKECLIHAMTLPNYTGYLSGLRLGRNSIFGAFLLLLGPSLFFSLNVLGSAILLVLLRRRVCFHVSVQSCMFPLLFPRGEIEPVGHTESCCCFRYVVFTVRIAERPCITTAKPCRPKAHFQAF